METPLARRQAESRERRFFSQSKVVVTVDGSSKKFAETTYLEPIRRATGSDRDTREGMIAGLTC